ncbi:Monothiol glutaredoxin-S14 chloroplastic -like protein [Tripterygium wilfordii]|uniref:Monothiol glutaredoxin-S14 chloroplastic -like protein n=1 Tax=Tripterygium wilfordii TaxID=458696 RepID=A0A7J7DCL8_TRIWF|nr:monothiol glutaredoxin-S14, chloroplastic isoform X1 [Tripterygium wilfordii]KAF5744061.1 Monothiol glutaredoxin-S14 chloroplastic -like protein [Tripterygium wilfordii]
MALASSIVMGRITSISPQSPVRGRSGFAYAQPSYFGGIVVDKRKQLSFTLESNPRSRRISLSVRCSFSPALTPELKATLDKVVTSHKVILFMKGTKDFPMCGFSNTVVQILKSLNVPFETINILENEMLRQGMKEYSNWPTFPQLYIDGEFFGGCDIAMEAYKSGNLQELLEKAMCS